MPYTMNVTVPRITAATIASFEAQAPGISGFVKMPVINTVADAAKVAEANANKTLPRYEYVSKVETTTETATGWVIALRIAGD